MTNTAGRITVAVPRPGRPARVAAWGRGAQLMPPVPGHDRPLCGIVLSRSESTA